MLKLELASTASEVSWNGPRIESWARFHCLVRQSGRPLLARLGDFPDSVLVAGCQRSGTTALTRTLRCGKGISDIRFRTDDELAGALLLSGNAETALSGRSVFQTTYLNDRFGEYFEHSGFRLIWIIREPTAVVYSMLHNWNRGALKRLFDSCGRAYLKDIALPRSRLLSFSSPTRLEMACASYVAKATQTFHLAERLQSRLLIVDYDELAARKQLLLPRIFEFAGIEPDSGAMQMIHNRSVGKGSKFPQRIAELVRSSCGSLFERMREQRSIGASHAW